MTKHFGLMAPALLCLLAPVAAFAAPAPITLTDGYASSSNPKSGAAYMVLTNTGSATCTLAGVETDVAEKAEVHTVRDENGVTKMVAADPIVLAPGASHELKRGGDHLMLMGLTEKLEEGARVPLRLDFGDCGVVQAEIPVQNSSRPGAAMTGMDHGMDHDAGQDGAPHSEHSTSHSTN